MARCAIGLDFGTESARAVLVDDGTGRVLATAAHPYAHGVLDRTLPGSDERLPPDWALQHPGDWIDAAETLLRAMVRAAGAAGADDVAGIGIDFTSCTVLPAAADGTPLCLLPDFARDRHAWPKLWKHHAAQPYADRINAAAAEPGGEFLAFYGGKTSSEWMWAKGWQLLAEAPASLSRAAGRWIEGGDWLVWQLTGTEVRSAGQAGYKAHWQKDSGYPAREFWRRLDPALPGLLDLLGAAPRPLGTAAGGLVPAWASRTGLRAATPVAVAAIDAHAAVPALGVHDAGQLVMIMGTSTCHMLVNPRRLPVRGISGVVEDGILPGLFGYEAGQASVGDIFLWFVRTAVPGRYGESDVFERLGEEAARIAPGASGLLALDWWNGCRTPLVDAELSGALVGLTLTTEPPEIYRALLEATAYGTRRVIETFEAGGVPITGLHACGGLAERNPLLLQITADATGRPVAAAQVPDASAVGAAIYAAAAGDAERAGGMTDVIRRMGNAERVVYRPDDAARRVYDGLYGDYLEAAHYFGEGGNGVMRRLRALRRRRPVP